MKILVATIAAAFLLAGCTSRGTSTPGAAEMVGETPLSTHVAPTAPSGGPSPTLVTSPTAPAVQPTGVYTRTDAAGYMDTYFVDPNLEDTTPPLDGLARVRARLIKNGVRIGGMMIEVSWMQDGALQHCQYLPLYQNGCVIEVRGYAPGVFVPVTVTVLYQGSVFMGYGGFTPE